jgi:hypothetical protein
MAMKNIFYLFYLLILSVVFILSCNKNESITNISLSHDKSKIDKLNAFLPSEDAYDRYNLILHFKEQYKAYQSDLKSDIVFEDKSAALARYEMETSLLNDDEICYLKDSTVLYSCDKRSGFTLSNVDFDGEGNPIISGSDMMQKYQYLENEMNNLNMVDSLVISIQIHIVGFDENITEFSVDYTIGTWGEFMGCWTMVINPWEDPIPFEDGISLDPCEGSYLNACSEITKKLNPHNPVPWCNCDFGFPFVEHVDPWYSAGWNDNFVYQNIFWANTGCETLTTEELNYYLFGYKDVLDDIRHTGGYDNRYTFKCTVYHYLVEHNELEDCIWWGQGGIWVCNYHYMVCTDVRVTCIPPSTE